MYSEGMIKKFMVLEQSLKNSNKTIGHMNKMCIGSIQKCVDREPSKAQIYLDAAKEIDSSVKYFLEHIHTFKNNFAKGYANKFITTVDCLILFLNQEYTKIRLDTLKLDALISLKKNYTSSDWAEDLFRDIPIEGIDLMLIKVENDFKYVESEMLSNIASSIQWFMCIHLMTTSKKPFSGLEMMRQLGFKRYEPVWNMMRKIRIMMGKRDERYTLKGTVEMDEGFFEVVSIPKRNELGEIIDERKELTRGRGSERQGKVLVSVESEPIEHEFKHKKKRVMGYVKMEVLDDLGSFNINNSVSSNIDKDSHIITDSWRGYSKLKDVVEQHTPMIVKPKESMEKLPWVHTIISNCKRELLGVHHSIGKEYLQLYLNEFCYKLN